MWHPTVVSSKMFVRMHRFILKCFTLFLWSLSSANIISELSNQNPTQFCVVHNSNVESDADTIMLSAMSSLKAQLLPTLTIGNCCSNFHALLNDFLSEGCGAARDSQFLCLQEYEDPMLRVCCGWHRQCIAEKNKLMNLTKSWHSKIC